VRGSWYDFGCCFGKVVFMFCSVIKLFVLVLGSYHDLGFCFTSAVDVSCFVTIFFWYKSGDLTMIWFFFKMLCYNIVIVLGILV